MLNLAYSKLDTVLSNEEEVIYFVYNTNDNIWVNSKYKKL